MQQNVLMGIVIYTISNKNNTLVKSRENLRTSVKLKNQAHNLKVRGSNPLPATNARLKKTALRGRFSLCRSAALGLDPEGLAPNT